MIDNGYSESERYIENIRIISAGHIFAKKGRRIERPNGRKDFLLFYVATGSESFFFGESKVTARAGSVIFFKPDEPQIHECEYEGTSEFYYVHFDVDAETVQSIICLDSSCVYGTFSGGSLAGIFQRIVSELQYKRKYYEEVSVQLLKELFFTVRRKIEEKDTDVGTAKQKLVQKIIHEINISWNKGISLDEYAFAFGLSKYYFVRIFKDSTGLSPIAYRNKIRLRHAEEMLLDSDNAVSLISEECGFETGQYFCDAFKKEYGISPSEYRRQNVHF